MAKFHFALEALLKARRLAEQGHQRAVAEIEQERLKLEFELRHQQFTIAEGRRALQNSLVGQVQTHALRMHAASSMHMMRQAQRVVLELAGVHRRLDSARGELIEATRRRRAVELLRERRFEQWKAAIDKAENNSMDELAVIAASSQSISSEGRRSAFRHEGLNRR